MFFLPPETGWLTTFLSFNSQVQFLFSVLFLLFLLLTNPVFMPLKKKKLLHLCCSTLNQSPLRCTSSFSCESPAARPNNVEQWKCQSGSFMTDLPQSRGRRAVRVQLILAALLAWVAGSSWEFDSNSVLWLYFWDNWSLSAPCDSSHLASIRSGPMRNCCCCMFKKKLQPFSVSTVFIFFWEKPFLSAAVTCQSSQPPFLIPSKHLKQPLSFLF